VPTSVVGGAGAGATAWPREDAVVDGAPRVASVLVVVPWVATTPGVGTVVTGVVVVADAGNTETGDAGPVVTTV
jgi:hypothetical protein